MYDDIGETRRVDQAEYWIWFGGTLVLTMTFFGVGAYRVWWGDALTGVLLLLLTLPLTIYFRVIMMRRCRDINWPASLPWLLLGAGFLAGLIPGMEVRTATQASAAVLALPTILCLTDFIFMIAIGCISSASSFDYETEYNKYARDHGLNVNKQMDAKVGAAAQPAVHGINPEPPRPSFGRKSR